MKKYIVIVMLGLSFSVFAGGPQEKAYWVCSQLGYLDNNLSYALSNIFKDTSNRYEEKERLFEKRVYEITKGKFEVLDNSSCRDFSSRNKAERYLTKIFKKARKKFKILWIDFGGL